MGGVKSEHETVPVLAVRKGCAKERSVSADGQSSPSHPLSVLIPGAATVQWSENVSSDRHVHKKPQTSSVALSFCLLTYHYR